MKVPVFIVDTFTSHRFKGNPTGVCYLEERLPTKHMLSVTRELNLPVTVFITKKSDGIFSIRYFTPLTEILACGHATLGAAAVVWKLTGTSPIEFHTEDGTMLSVHHKSGVVRMQYPSFEMKEHHASAGLLQSLHIDSYKSLHYCAELETLFIELQAAEQLEAIQPDFKKLVASDDQIKEVVITCAAEKPYDYLLRSFCPWIGIDEDPVTGSVHAALAPFWAGKLNSDVMRARQLSARGGEAVLRIENNSVQIEGQYVVALSGNVHLPSSLSPFLVRDKAGSGIENRL